MNIYDLTPTEVLWRLTKSGDNVGDFDANIGYTTSILSNRVCKDGKVTCFEPNPILFSSLSSSISNWAETNGFNNVTVYNKALSSEFGIGCLKMPIRNIGEGFIEKRINNTKNFKTNKYHSFKVECLT